jgi:uncharacterized membrane protein
MLKLVFALLTGLVGALLLHIVIILSVPHVTSRDAYSRVAAEGEAGRFVILKNKPDAAGLASVDPTLRTGVCAISLADGPVQVSSEGPVPFWSLVVYDDNSNEVFSMIDRTSVTGDPDVVLATPAQINALRKNLPEDASESILVEMPEETGFVVLRTFVPLPSLEEGAATFLSNAGCDPL